MHNGNYSRIITIDATPSIAGRSLNNPEVSAQLATVDIDIELLRPEIKDPGQIVSAPIAVVPAINDTKGFVTPVPVPAFQRRVHRILHFIEVDDLAYH